MAILFGFAPWIVYWVLVGNVPFTTAVLVALAIAVAAFVIGRAKGGPGRTLEIGGIATFLVLTVLTFALSQSFMERWMQPLSNAGIFLVALTSVLIDKPFVREFAKAGQPAEVGPREFRWWETTLDSRGPRRTKCANGGAKKKLLEHPAFAEHGAAPSGNSDGSGWQAYSAPRRG